MYSLEKAIQNPVIQLILTLLLAIAGWKMDAGLANVFLFCAWALSVVLIYRLLKSCIQRIAIRWIMTALMGLISAIPFYGLSTWSAGTGVSPRIEALGAGSAAEYGIPAFVSLQIVVLNSGEPTALEDFELSLVLNNGVRYEGKLLSIPDDGLAIDYRNGRSEMIAREESLDERALTAIETGGKLTGRLIFAFDTLNPDQVLNPNTIAILSMKDVKGRSYLTPPFSPRDTRSGPDGDFPGLSRTQPTRR